HEGLDFLEDLRSKVPPEVSEGTQTTISSRRYLEFNLQGVDKGTGISWLADHLGIGMEDVIGCGDALNDLEMIRAVGCGVVVANATDDVRAVADYQATSTCEDGVFAEVLSELIEPQHR
ncbi:MAG: HAD-IIB family hydrolase, partial [Atopobiaceae bacterium]|nr:HAD-IIB family hydrolase [Atopobiaceae bacterium]